MIQAALKHSIMKQKIMELLKLIQFLRKTISSMKMILWLKMTLVRVQ